MRIERLEIRSLPGIAESFVLEPAPGVNLLYGPNAAGKSSVARAVQDLLWPAAADGQARWLRATLSDAEGESVVSCDGRAPVWARAGAPAARPNLPEAHHAACYRITAADLLGGDHGFDRGLAAAIRKEMTGGVDLDKLVAALARPLTRRRNELEARARDAIARTATVERAQADLDTRRQGLEDLRAAVTTARAAGRRAAALEAAHALASAEGDLARAADTLAAIPYRDVLPVATAGDAEEFRILADRIAAKTLRLSAIEAERAALARDLDAVRLPRDGDASTHLARLAGLVRALQKAEAALVAARDQHAVATRGDDAARSAAAVAAADPEPDSLVRVHRLLLEVEPALGALEDPDEPAAGRPRPALPWLAAAALLTVAAAAPLPGGLPVRLAAAGAAIALGAWGAVRLAAARTSTALGAAKARRDALASRLRAVTGRYEQRSEELARLTALVDECAQCAAAALSHVAEACRDWGEDAPRHGAEAEALHAALAKRAERAQSLQDELARTGRDLDSVRLERDEALRLRDALLARLGLAAGTSDSLAVSRIIEQLDPWRRAVAAHQSATTLLSERTRRWRELADQALIDPDRRPQAGDLERLIAEARSQEHGLPDLEKELSTLERDLAAAEAGHDLAAALAEEAEAREELAALEDEATLLRLEAALLDDLRRRHESIAAPRQLRDANDLLAAFTRDRCSLALGRDESGTTFAVRDHESREIQQLGDLSDGTRMQVLLAVRLAFLAAIETTAHPPLFLDETLTTTDPLRLAAAAEALGRAAQATGRQVFYLTSQPGDVGAWRGALAAAGLPEPHLLDLAAARRRGAAATADELLPSLPEPVPVPRGDDTPATYGLRLGAGAFDPHAGWEALDTYHLASPDLDLAYRLRVAGAARSGVMARRLAALAGQGIVADGERRRLEIALAVARAFVPAWTVGRPRPARIADIDACSAVTDTMRPRVLELLAREGWNAKRFMAEAGNRGVKGLQQKVRDELRSHLDDRGLLDERSPLEGEALAGDVVLRTCAGNEDARTSLENVRALVHRLSGAIPRAIADDPSSRPSSGSDPTG